MDMAPPLATPRERSVTMGAARPIRGWRATDVSRRSPPAGERQHRGHDPARTDRHRSEPDEPDPRERRDGAERDRDLEQRDRCGVAVVEVEEVVGLALLRVTLPLLLLRLLLDA